MCYSSKEARHCDSGQTLSSIRGRDAARLLQCFGSALSCFQCLFFFSWCSTPSSSMMPVSHAFTSSCTTQARLFAHPWPHVTQRRFFQRPSPFLIFFLGPAG